MNFVIFPMYFLSTALYPLWKLQESGAEWVYQLARFNPFTHAVEWIRFALYGKDPGVAPCVVLGCLAVFFAAGLLGLRPAARLRRADQARRGRPMIARGAAAAWRRRPRWRSALASPLAPRAGVDAFPSRPITLWVPWAAGGATDISLRLLAELASHALGQPVLVENRGGAGGTLAMPVLQQAEPDGYTIAQMPQPVFRAPFTQKVLWDPVRDITPIIQVSGVTFGVLVPAASALRTLDDLFAFARAQPGRAEHRDQRRRHHAARGARRAVHRARPALHPRAVQGHVRADDRGRVGPGDGRRQLHRLRPGGRRRPAAAAGHLRRAALASAGRRCRRCASWASTSSRMSPYGLAGPRGLPPPVVAALHDAFKTRDVRPARSSRSSPSTTRRSTTSAPRTTPAPAARSMPASA